MAGLLAWANGPRRRAVLAFILGILAAAGQAPVEAWFLTLPALAGLIVLIKSQRWQPKSAAFTAWFGGAGYFCAALSWLVSPFLVEADSYAWMAPFALLLMGFGLALFWTGAVWLGVRAARPALGVAVALAGAELARGYLFTGFPWALLGHVWTQTPIGQMAAFVGPNGLALLTTLAAAALAAGAVWGRLATAGALAGLWGLGLWTLAQPMPADSQITLRLVQPNAQQALKWDESQAGVFFDRLIAATEALPRVDYVIWPETALPYLLEYNQDLTSVIAQAAGGASVIFGRQRIEGDRGYNSLSVLSPTGIEIALYDKHHLTPFGEYIPFGDLAYDWFGLTGFAAQLGNVFSAGLGPRIIDLGAGGKMLPLICYEAVFPQNLRVGGARADWLLHITNDAWFGTLTGPYQHAAQARLRAIEQGLPMVRVANTGVTAVYDARGRLRADLPFGTTAHLDTVLPGPLPITPYARWGDWIALVLLFCAVLAACLPKARSRY